VTCNKNAMKDNSLWMIETATHPNRQYQHSPQIQPFLISMTVPHDAQKVNYRLPGFLEKFWELQKVMWITNAGLTDRHVYDSRPGQWPQLRRGIVRDDCGLYAFTPLKRHAELLGQGSQTNLPYWQPFRLVVEHTRRYCLYVCSGLSHSSSKTRV